MEWLSVSIHTTTEGIEPLCGRLMNKVSGFEIEDKNDFEDFLLNNHEYWDYVDEKLREKMSGETLVKIYLQDDEEGHITLKDIRSELAAMKSLDTDGIYGTLDITFESMKEEDWENNWKQYFKPIYVGDSLIIKPQWEQIENTDGKIVFNIDPGLTFGSGQHETTRMCVETLIDTVKKGDKVLDLGCGSGILSIISLMLGAKNASAVDIDPNCEKTAYANAALNKIGKDVYKVVSGNILTDDKFKEETASDGPFDIVVANIVADVIIPLCDDVHKYIKKGGTFIASGIINLRFEEVRQKILESGFDIIDIKNQRDWYCITAKPNRAQKQA